MTPTRRGMLAGSACLLAQGAVAADGLRVILLGQALIQHDLRQLPWRDRERFADLFAHADACFTDLETTIIGPNGGATTRDPALLHRAAPDVLDCLSDLHVNLFATANNHAFDVGTGGITDTMDALAARKLAFAGTGLSRDLANAPAFLPAPHGRVALVAMATGKIRDGGAATPRRAGVNEVRQAAPGVLNEEDVGIFLASIAAAAKQAKLVIACNHNHYWEPDIADVPAWQGQLAHRCIDAGASVFVGHGAPLLQGIEVYRGRPIFYDVGNFIYQSPSRDNPYGPETWRSIVVDATFDSSGGLVGARLVPITLNAIGIGGADDFQTKGCPSFADGAAATEILAQLVKSSRPFGTTIKLSGNIGSLQPA